MANMMKNMPIQFNEGAGGSGNAKFKAMKNLDESVQKKMTLKEKLQQFGVKCSVSVRDRTYCYGGTVDNYSQISVSVSKEGSASATTMKEFQYRGTHWGDDWSQYIESAKLKDFNIAGDKIVLVIEAKPCGNYEPWTTEFVLKLKPAEKMPSKEELGELEAKCTKAANAILVSIKERQKYAVRRNWPDGSGEKPYDEPRLVGKEISKDGKYAVFVIEEMIDYRVEDGKQLRYTAYKVDGKGNEPKLLYEDHAYERLGSAKIAIIGSTSEGIVLQTSEGKKIV